MMCPANYAWVDARQRSELGMNGGSTIGSIYVPGGEWAASICDQSNAFTSVVVPDWMRLWCAAPPLRAHDIWSLLSPELQAKTGPFDWIAPCYRRLAMGSSHSVHLLMSMNIEAVGRALWQSRRIASEALGTMSRVQVDVLRTEQLKIAPGDEVHDVLDLDDDEQWLRAQTAKRSGRARTSAPAWTLDSWCAAVRAAARESTRVFVVMHLFAGERRAGDVEDAFFEAMAAAGLVLLFLSADIADDPRWDLSVPETFMRLREIVTEGLVDMVMAGPPCATWSRLRFRAGGGGAPSPLPLDAMGAARRLASRG